MCSIEAPVDSVEVQAAPGPLEAGSRSGIRVDRREIMGKSWGNRWKT